MNELLVNVINARKEYEGGQVIALDGVNLQVSPGEFVAITGPSGSGKTTLLNLVGAMDIPDSGEIIINGFPVSTRRELDRIRAEKIGFVFQMHNLIPVLTARQNVELPMLPRAIKAGERRERALDLLDEVGLRPRADSSIQGLSGGERQRVAIARALANSPSLLLADEPTGNLDTTTGAEVMALLHEQRTRTGAALVLVTHNDELCLGADQRIHMQDGKIL
jgi:ABC-type lipoprotein export system ATPase subunit